MSFETAKMIIAAVFMGLMLIELLNGRLLFRAMSTMKDTILDIAATVIVPIVIAPVILFTSAQLTRYLTPGTEDQWGHWSPWLMFAVLLIADDLTQYAWHRLSHTSWLYPLHRAHHSAPYLSIRVVYRNNFVYYAFMPGLWLSGMLIHWGFMAVYPIYAIIKMSVIMSAHSSVPWDAPLYKNRFTQPIMWWVERIISTPATHSAHHGLHASDNATHYQGNYGNLLFLWDIIFGTAHITRQRPQEFGIENLEPVSWSRELVWPKATVPVEDPPSN